MIITVVSTLTNGVYKAIVSTEASSIEVALMSAYGEPRIDVTGTIPYTKLDTTSSTFVIAGGPSMVYIRSGMPISFSMDSNVDPEAHGKVHGWSVEMKNRIAGEITTLKTKPLLSQPDIVHYEA
jgi:hypothetical protein